MEETISIIIPAWNEEKTISETCIFLNKLKLPFKYNELIFIAGGNDNTYRICKEIRLDNFNEIFTLKQEPRDFKSGALIKGIKKATGNNIILIDADTLVPSNLVIEIVNSLKKFDAVMCDYLPKIRKGFMYDYYIINKLISVKNPKKLSSLFGGATISLRREIIEEIGIKNLFTSKSRAGVDYYMSLILKKNKKSMGFVRDAHVITPRSNNIKGFFKNNNRWISAFFDLHQENKRIILTELILSILFSLFPPIIFFYIISKMIGIYEEKYLKLKYLFLMFFFEYLNNIMNFKTFIRKLAGKSKPIGHFKGSR